MLYETAGRAGEILGISIGELDFAGRRCLVEAESTRAKARRRSQAREVLTGRCSSPTAARGRARASAPATSARAQGRPGCRTSRPERCRTNCRHQKPGDVRRCIKASSEAVSGLTSLFASGGSSSAVSPGP
ncbi:hypothetical protein GCM10009566_74270 [Streptomyces murinus]